MIIRVPFVATLTWQLVFDYDNSNNSATIEHSIQIRQFQSISMSNFREEITQYAYHQASSQSDMGFDASASYRTLSASLKEVTALALKTREQKDVRYENVSQETRRYQIGPKSRLELYQLYFNAPGMSYACNALSTTKKPDEKVVFYITMEPITFISNIKVVYGGAPSQAPPNRIREIGGLSDDINHRYGGDYVWLVPEYTTNVDNAVTGFDLFIQKNGAPMPDLAKGAGGQFRYLVPIRSSRERRKLTEVALMRRGDGDSRPPGFGFTVKTSDLNRHRGKDFLYVVAQDVEVDVKYQIVRDEVAERQRRRRRELEEALTREREKREAAEAARARLEANWQSGIPPGLASLTREQIAQARSSYLDGSSHIAFVGSSGTGKSTMTNSIRGLRATSPGAAPVGQTECTRNTNSYEDPQHARVVWYDVPGAGTPNIPDWQYFMDHKLYAFDALVIVFSDRITQNDIRVLGNAAELDIPVFLVRSKSDQIMHNMEVDLDLSPGESRARYVQETRVYVREVLGKVTERVDVEKRVYLVTREGVRRAAQGLSYEAALDERQLLDDLLQVVGRGSN